METKPFSLQSPEQIAKDYSGNKQKIAEAMQLGILDPTAGTLAAMFIDRMRSAAQQEAVPQQTVAQQVFAPPPMSAGLGATPQAAMAAPPAPAPVDASAIPSGGLGGLPQTPTPEAAPPMGMAMGGMVAPYASGGLSDLPIPDDMFDEPRDGGYANGGLVAFAQAGEVRSNIPEATGETIEVVAPEPDNSPESYYGFFRDPELMREQIGKLYTPQRKYSDQLTKFYEDIMAPEAQSKRRKEDMWLALGQIGAKMASTPGSLLQAASAGIGEALPGVLAASKERRAEQRDAIKTLAQNEGLNNKEALDLAKLTLEGTGKYGEFDIKRLDREQRERFEILRDKRERWQTLQQVGAQIRSAQIGTSAQLAFMDRQLLQLQRQVAGAAVAQLPELRAALNNPIGLANNAYRIALGKFGANSQQAAAAYNALQQAEDAYVQTAVQRATGGMSGGSGGGYGAPPQGAVQRVN